jgi:aldose 1-epimerase
VTYDPWALHGTVLRQPVEVIELIRSESRALLVGQVVEHPGWPFPMAVDVIWDLRERELITEINVYPFADEFPAVVGWHPWFRRDLGRGAPLEWSVDATAQVERGGDHLPTGRLVDVGSGPFDDAFVVPDGHASVRWPGALTIDIHNDHEWFVVFDELAASACIEPQSGPPNAFNDDLGRPGPLAAPGRPHLMVTRWTMRDDPQGDRA